MNSTEPIEGLDPCLDEIEAESLGLLPLEPGAYLHVSDPNATHLVIVIVGVPQSRAAVIFWIKKNRHRDNHGDGFLRHSF